MYDLELYVIIRGITIDDRGRLYRRHVPRCSREFKFHDVALDSGGSFPLIDAPNVVDTSEIKGPRLKYYASGPPYGRTPKISG